MLKTTTTSQWARRDKTTTDEGRMVCFRGLGAKCAIKKQQSVLPCTRVKNYHPHDAGLDTKKKLPVAGRTRRRSPVYMPRRRDADGGTLGMSQQITVSLNVLRTTSSRQAISRATHDSRASAPSPAPIRTPPGAPFILPHGSPRRRGSQRKVLRVGGRSVGGLPVQALELLEKHPREPGTRFMRERGRSEREKSWNGDGRSEDEGEAKVARRYTAAKYPSSNSLGHPGFLRC